MKSLFKKGDLVKIKESVGGNDTLFKGFGIIIDIKKYPDRKGTMLIMNRIYFLKTGQEDIFGDDEIDKKYLTPAK
jgi:hypothetical protein